MQFFLRQQKRKVTRVAKTRMRRQGRDTSSVDLDTCLQHIMRLSPLRTLLARTYTYSNTVYAA